MISSCVSLRTLVLNILSAVLTVSSQASFTVEFGGLALARKLAFRAFCPSLLTEVSRLRVWPRGLLPFLFYDCSRFPADKERALVSIIL